MFCVVMRGHARLCEVMLGYARLWEGSQDFWSSRAAHQEDDSPTWAKESFNKKELQFLFFATQVYKFTSISRSSINICINMRSCRIRTCAVEGKKLIEPVYVKAHIAPSTCNPPALKVVRWYTQDHLYQVCKHSSSHKFRSTALSKESTTVTYTIGAYLRLLDALLYWFKIDSHLSVELFS